MSEITICPEEAGWRLTSNIWLPKPIDRVFEFFADAGNLETLTPPWLNFQILTPQPIEMGEGTLIDYRLRLRMVPIRWRTEIKDWQPPYRFVDQQLRGPYRQWVHTHTFESRDGGTFVGDDVTYAIPGGRLVHDWLVGPDLKRIFQFRHDQLLAHFSGSTTFPPETLKRAEA